jgi:hypothetical protein
MKAADAAVRAKIPFVESYGGKKLRGGKIANGPKGPP